MDAEADSHDADTGKDCGYFIWNIKKNGSTVQAAN